MSSNSPPLLRNAVSMDSFSPFTRVSLDMSKESFNRSSDTSSSSLLSRNSDTTGSEFELTPAFPELLKEDEVGADIVGAETLEEEGTTTSEVAVDALIPRCNAFGGVDNIEEEGFVLSSFMVETVGTGAVGVETDECEAN